MWHRTLKMNSYWGKLLVDQGVGVFHIREGSSIGYKPKAYLRDYVYVAQDPKDELLLG